jgi:hypothetical protein
MNIIFLLITCTTENPASDKPSSPPTGCPDERTIGARRGAFTVQPNSRILRPSAAGSRQRRECDAPFDIDAIRRYGRRNPRAHTDLTTAWNDLRPAHLHRRGVPNGFCRRRDRAAMTDVGRTDDAAGPNP